MQANHPGESFRRALFTSHDPPDQVAHSRLQGGGATHPVIAQQGCDVTTRVVAVPVPFVERCGASFCSGE